MTKKSILIATDLDIWSMGGKVGAPSFYKTLELYNKKNFDIDLYTTEKKLRLDELHNVKITQLPTLPVIRIPYIRTLHKLFNYFLQQIIFILLFLKDKKDTDLLYGYEIGFIPALAFLSKIKKKPHISRFQGTILYPKMKERAWKIIYFQHFFSIRQNAHLTIMTNDGTQGDKVICNIRNNQTGLLFLKNGVVFESYDLENISNKIKKLGENNSKIKYNFISVSRLRSWKRVDRSLEIFQAFFHEFKDSNYIIVGEGEMKKELEVYVKNNHLDDAAYFTGAINSDEVNFLMSKSNIFLSHYELSNVGNPLWEAMNNNCLIVTLANGDTGKVIKDNYNGIISSEIDYLNNANKLINIAMKSKKIKEMKRNAKQTLMESVQSWDERMEREYTEVIKLIK